MSSPVSQMPKNSALEQGSLVRLLHVSLAQQTMMRFFPHQNEISGGEPSQLPHSVTA